VCVCAAAAIAVLAAAAAGGRARAQNDCFSEKYKPWGCGTKYTCEYIGEEGGSEVRTTEYSGPVRQPSGWTTTKACDCRLAPCGLVRQCPPSQATKSQEQKVCWEYGGSASVEAKVGYLIEILGKLGVTVSVDISREGCETLSEGLVYHIPWEQCFDTHGRDVSMVYEGKVYYRITPKVFVWRVTDRQTGKSYVIRIPCPPVSGVVSAKAALGRELQIAPYPERCGSIVPDPDVYDGKRSDPCCSPLPPCDPPPPDGKICCGCEGTR